MRCQKVRSYLSAYCNDELSGSVLRKVSDHLTACDHCRSEEIHYRELRSNAGTINTYKVSDGFNNRLLDRIAKERFNETRTKAYLPKAAPSIIIRRVVPILVTACLAIVIIMSNFTGDEESQPTNYASTNGQLDDSYRTVQPVNNPNMTGMMHIAQINKVVLRARLTGQPLLMKNEESHPPAMLPPSASRKIMTSGAARLLMFKPNLS